MQGETDEQFYLRQLDAINRHKAEKGVPEMDYEEYYNWAVDRMLRNLFSAAQALAGREEELKTRQMEKGCSPYGGVQLFQMAVPESDIIPFNDGDFSSVPLSNAGMRMVAAGVLLGDSGMGLDDVKKNCKRYFDLRHKGCPGAEAFEQLFNVDPMRVP